MGNEKNFEREEGSERGEGGSAAAGSPKPDFQPEQPDLRVVQPEVQLDGTTKFKPVGGLWRNVSKSGREFYTLKIGKLKLLVFPNDRERFSREQ